MRLTKKEIEHIKGIILTFDPDARVYLFGSRAKDHLKGGDIDLLIFSESISRDDKRAIKVKLYDVLGEQKIDLILAADANSAFVEIATKEGVLL